MESSPNVKPQTFRSVTTLIYIVVVGFFFSSYVVKNWAELKNSQFTPDYSTLLLSLLIWSMSYACFSLLWRRTLFLIEPKAAISRAESLRLYMITEFSKYVPGSVWAVLARTYFSQNSGANKKQVFASSLIDAVLTTAAILLLGALTLFVSFSQTNLFLSIAALLLSLVGMASLHPKIFFPILNAVFKFIKKPPLEGVSLGYSNILVLTLAYLMVYLVQGYSFFLFVSSFASVEITQLSLIVASYCLSIGLGILAVFAPSGIGVREGVMTGLLSLVIPPPTAFVISLASRLWMTAGEVILLGISSVLKRKASQT